MNEKDRREGDRYVSETPRGSADPRKLKGAIVGPGGAQDRGGVIVDTSNAVLLSDVTVSTIDRSDGDRGFDYFALMLAGRVNQTKDTAQVLFIMNTDGAAAIVTELLALLARTKQDPEVVGQFIEDLRQRLDTLQAEGSFDPVDD